MVGKDCLGKTKESDVGASSRLFIASIQLVPSVFVAIAFLFHLIFGPLVLVHSSYSCNESEEDDAEVPTIILLVACIYVFRLYLRHVLWYMCRGASI